MPYPNEHSARLASPAGFRRFARKKLPGVKGVDAIYGVRPDGKSEIQALRFAKDSYTVAQARAWLKDHPRFKVMMFEPARKEKANES
jgi:hypothetical protein